tara:strand:+ start:2635 stop:4257 length:1623 start_codon:yes stop_codon:yes gene_type:complete
MTETPLDRFRAETGTPRHLKQPPVLPPIPHRQWLLVFNTLLWFTLTLFWFRGGLGLWGSFVSLGLGLWTFMWLFVPAAPLSETDRPDGTPWAHIKRLLSFPFFWLGFAVLGYGILQTLNPAYELVPIPGKGARMEPLDFIEWLPSGVRVPLFMTNSPRAGLLQIALPWLMVCCLYVGLRSRRALDFLLNGVVAIVCLWTLMALGYYYTGSETIYWGIEMGVNNIPPFWGSLKNPNHAGTLQLIGAILSLGLAGRGSQRSHATHHFSGLQVFYVSVALFLSLSTFQSLSRGAIVLTVIVWLSALALAGVLAYRQRSFKSVSMMAFFLLLFVAGAIVWYVANTSGSQGKNNAVKRTLEYTENQLEDLKSGNSEIVDNRVYLNRISVRMFNTSPVYGYGIGSWSYFYRNHVDLLSEFEVLIAYYRLRDPEGNLMGEGVRYAVPKHYDHAHNEFLQYVCELGVIGAFLLSVLVLYIPARLLLMIHKVGIGFLGIVCLAVSFTFLLYSVIEFPLRTPALGLFVGLLYAAAQVESDHRIGRFSASD